MFGGAPKCRRCAKSVYAAEEVSAIGHKWHPQCFTCQNCQTRLSSITLTDKDGEIYCQSCYTKSFGPKGFGIGNSSIGTGVSVSDTGSCGQCGAKGQTNKFCGECGKPTARSVSPAPAPVRTVSPAPPSPQPVSQTVKPSSIKSSSPAAAVGGGDLCHVCSKRVYSAESVQAAGHTYHDFCLKCRECKNRVSSTTMADKNGEVYCTTCYGKLFGPKGFGIGNHAVYTQ